MRHISELHYKQCISGDRQKLHPGPVEVTGLQQTVNVNIKAFLEYFRYYLRYIDDRNKMGAHLARRYVTETDTEPDPSRTFEFDPSFGFPERQERGWSRTAD